MKLKVLSIDLDNYDQIKRSIIDCMEILNSRMIEEENFYNETYYAFKYLHNLESTNLGVQSSNGDLDALEETLSANDQILVKIRFFVLDTLNGNLYYNGNQNDVKVILKELFDIPFTRVNIIIDDDEFEKLKYIRIRVKESNQLSFDDDLARRMNPIPDLISDLANLDDLRSSSYEVTFKETGSLINRNKFNQILTYRKKGQITITARGFNKHGDSVKLSSSIIKEIEILPAIIKWQDSLRLSLENLVIAIKGAVSNENL